MPRGREVSTSSTRENLDWLQLGIRISYAVQGLFNLQSDVVEVFENGTELFRRTVRANSPGQGRVEAVVASRDPKAVGRYWIYMCDRGRNVAQVEYEVTP